MFTRKDLLMRLEKAEAKLEKASTLLTQIATENADLKARIEILEKGYAPLFDYFLESKRETPEDRRRKFAPNHTIHPNEDYEVH